MLQGDQALPGSAAQLHDTALPRLVPGLQFHITAGEGQGALDVAGLGVAVGELAQQRQRMAVKEFPTEPAPVLELRAIRQGQTRQEFAPVQINHALHGRGPGLGFCGESRDIHAVDAGRVEAHGLALHQQAGRVCCFVVQHPPQVRKHLPQVGALPRCVGPEKRRQLFAGMPAILHDQVGQQGAAFVIGRTAGLLALDLQLPAAQQGQAQSLLSSPRICVVAFL